LSGLCFWFILMLIMVKTVYLKKQNKDLTDLILLHKSNSGLAINLNIILFSIAGFPPLIGFLTKIGLFLAVFYAVRNILMKKKVASYHGSMLMFYQMTIITLVLWPVFFIFKAEATVSDWQALLVLALVTTSIGHTLFVMSFKNFSIGTASIISSIQPIYGILFGLFFLNEIPASSTIFGGFLIILTVAIESFRTRKI